MKSVNCTKNLGVEYFNDYNETFNKNWEILDRKLKVTVGMLSRRFLSIHEQAIIVNYPKYGLKV